MTKQTKEKDEPRRVGPKFARNVLPENFQIRRPTSPMAELLDEARKNDLQIEKIRSGTEEEITPVKQTPVISTPVKTPGAVPGNDLAPRTDKSLPPLIDFIDGILPRFPPARQSILLRLYRWSEGVECDIVVSTPRLAAKTNMDEKACRTHLHALIADGFLRRSMVGDQIAQFGGSDRTARGLMLRLSAQALSDLLD